jgi:DNA-binding MarR family transcriptional regulator
MNPGARDEYVGSIDDRLRDLFGTFLRPETPPSREMNITMGQMHCLGTIAHLGNPTMSQVAEALRLHPSTVTVLVDGLVAHGLARRAADAKDRRVVRVSETARGRHNHERHMARMRARVAEMLAGLSDADLAKVHESLDLLWQAAKQHAESKDQRETPEPARGAARRTSERRESR